MDFKKKIEDRAKSVIDALDGAYGDLDLMISNVNVDNLPEKEHAEIKAGLERLAEVEQLTSPALRDLVNTLNKKR